MPTGYTAAIKDGITFEQFLWSCARGMGALILMRDEPADAPIPERFEPSPFYQKRAAEERAEYARLANLSAAEIQEEADAAYRKDCAHYDQVMREAAELRRKYAFMLGQVMAWSPPTHDHEGFKAFMVSQIEDSIKWDCVDRDYPQPERKAASNWRIERMSAARKLAERFEVQHEEELARTAGRNEWIHALRESLK